MKIPLRITFQDMPDSAAVEQVLQAKAEKIEHFYPQLIGCHITVQTLGRHKHQGRQFSIRIDLTAPGKEIVVNRDHDEDIYVAIRDAFDSARRQLEDYARVQRGQSKVHEPEYLGRIARTFSDEGYGFIEASDGRECYFSGDNVVNGELGDLKPGTQVRFLLQDGGEGLQARRVSIAKHMTRV